MNRYTRVGKVKNILKWLKDRFSFRLHMFLVLGGVVCVGAITSKLLLAAGMTLMPARWALATLAGYAAFFVGIRTCIAYASWRLPKPYHPA